MIAFEWIVCLIGGTALGGDFYGGLWLTVQHLTTSHSPALLAAGSLAVRISIVMGGVLLLSHGQWQNAVAVLLGLMAGRFAISRYLASCT